MLCSTVIPTINRPSLERSVKSAVAQDLDPEDHEIIVVNDSGRPLPGHDWIKSPQIAIVNTNRCDRSVVCNAGAALGTGKYLKILQDDDYLLPGGLRALIDVAESTQASLVYGAFKRVDDGGTLMSVQMPEVSGNLFAHAIAGDNFHLSVSLLRRDRFFEVGGFDPLIVASEDLDLLVKLTHRGEIAYTEHVVGGIRVGPHGNTSTQWTKKIAECRMIRERGLELRGAFRRIVRSIGPDMTLAGRCCRAYGISALLNLRAANLCTAVRRLAPAAALAARHAAHPAFWRGLGMRSHWHRNEREREEAHYAVHYPAKFKPQWW